MAGGDPHKRKKTGIRYRVAGSKPGNARGWYSPATYSIGQANAVLDAAKSSADPGEDFWIERFRNNRWERM